MTDGKRVLEGKKVLITGGAKRIGRGLALEFARAGAAVAITYRNSADEAEQVLRKIGDLGVDGMALRMDVRVPESVTAGVGEAIEEMGGLDILVNNAGHFETAILEALTVAQWDVMQETNTRGPLLVAQAAHAKLREARGRIINIGSLGGLHPWTTHAHYCASKAALHMLSQTMAKAWAPEISVNCVAPGMVVEGEVDPGYEAYAAKTPMGRNGTVSDVAAGVMFFATAPQFITGQILAVDGGLGL
jgi:3-oxoacyl-[acyl-carrier protein] reductase/pteridine reductase